jgi:hypothetical protein
MRLGLVYATLIRMYMDLVAFLLEGDESLDLPSVIEWCFIFALWIIHQYQTVMLV